MAFLLVAAGFILWLATMYRIRGTKALPYVATLPLWGPFAVWFLVMVPEWLS